MGDVLKQAQSLNATFASLQKQMAGLNAQSNQMHRLRNGFPEGNDWVPGIREAMAATGQYRTGAIKAISATEAFTTALDKQDVTLKTAIKQRKQFNHVLQEQYRLHKMAVLEWSTDERGRISADMFIPRDVPQAMNSFGEITKGVAKDQITLAQGAEMARMRIGLLSEITRSAGLNMVNLGKNTQWAGRQMMVGISLPLAAFAAGSAMIAYEVEKELTRIARVYNTTGRDILSEQNAVKEASLRTAKGMASEYGMALNETLDITAQLAATGQQGLELQKNTKAIAELTVIGELDRQAAISAGTTLNATFGTSLLSLAEQYQYLNNLENDTIVSSQDMIDIIPKLAGIVNELGGGITDVGTLAAAARVAGLNAKEAGNALKSISFRNVAPTSKAAKMFKEMTEIDFQDLIDQTNGQVIPMIKAIQAATADLEKPKRIALFKELAGLYQGNKALMIGSAFLDPETGDMNEQVKRAEQIGAAGSEAWKKVWDRETKTYTESLPVRFKRAVETIKAEMYEIGTPFLEIGIKALDAITPLLSAFNELSSGTKQFILFGAIAVAVIGPLVMVTGVFLNLLGTIIKASGSLGMMASRFKSVNVENRVTSLLSKAASGAYLNQAESAIVLNQQLHNIERNLKAITGIAPVTDAALDKVVAPRPAATATGGGVVGGPSEQGRSTGSFFVDAEGNMRDKKGKLISNKVGAARARSMMEQHDKILARKRLYAQAEAKHSQAMTGTTGAVMGTVGAMTMLAGGTNKWLMYLGLALTVFPLFFPMINKLIARIGVMIGLMAGGSGFKGAVGKAGTAMAGLAKFAGPIGIAVTVAAAAWGIFQYRAKKAQEEMNKVANAGDSMAEAMGAQALKVGEYIDQATGETKKGMGAFVDEFIKNNEAVVKNLGRLNKERGDAGINSSAGAPLKQAVLEIGLDVYRATGDAVKAKDAVQAALTAAGAPELFIDIKTDFNSTSFTNEILKDSAEAFMNRSVEVGFSWELDDKQLKSQSTEMAERLGETYGQVLSGAIKPEEGIKQFKIVDKQMTDAIDDIINKFDGKFSKREIKMMKGFGVDPNDTESIRKAFIANDKFRSSITASTAPTLLRLRGDLKNTVNGYRDLSMKTAETTGLMNAQGVNGRHLTTVHEYLTGSMNVLAGAAARAGANVGNVAEPDDEAALEDLSAKALEAALSMDRLQSAAKDAMSGGWGAVMDMYADAAESQMQAEMDDLQRAGERKSDSMEAEREAQEERFDARKRAEDRKHENARKAFDARWDTTMANHDKRWEARKDTETKAYDRRIEGIRKTIEAERDAEAKRQAIFEAEKRRIQRLAELYSNNIDFNVALGSGNLDEAARIGANTQATTEGWAIEDAAEGSGNASERRITALEKSVEAIEKEKTVRLAAIDKMEEAEKAALEKRKEREQESLEQAKENAAERFRIDSEAAQKGYEARKKAEEDAQKARETAMTKSHEATKKALELDLLALKEFIPKDEAELFAHVKDIEAVYGEHGLTVNKKGNEWGAQLTKSVRTHGKAAAATLRNDINWAKFGKDSATAFIAGAFDGMTVAKFIATFGNPAGGVTNNGARNTNLGPSNAPRTTNAPAGKPMPRRGQVAHEGGEIYHGGGKVSMGGKRTGYPASAKKFPSEVDTRLRIGEFVMQNKAVNTFGVPFMKSINEGQLPTFHDGGPLGMPGVAAAMLSGVMQTAIFGAIKNAKTLGGGEGMASGSFEKGGKSYPSAVNGRISANTAAAQRFIRERWPSTRNGGDPSLNRADPRSDHGRGKALDIFPGVPFGTYARGSGLAQGWEIANHMVNNPKDFGTKYVIWQKKINSGGGWRDYTRYGANPGPTLGHYDHVHLSVLHGGGMTGEGLTGQKLPNSKLMNIGVPVGGSSLVEGLRNGGITINEGYAKLHPREAVLTAPLTAQLQEGIGNFANSGGNEYNVKVDMRGATIARDVDMTRSIKTAIRQVQAEDRSKKGMSRKVGS